jgi:eukaryotic-like serine/threonine-protein kinase
MDLEIGQLLDNKYKIVRLLGEGGMGAVYEGENVRIHHRVAIKVLHPNVAADSGARERFEREAQAAGHIGSEHIVEVFDLGELPSGARYMVMEFLAGEPLSGRVEKLGRMMPAAIAPLMLQLLEGLGAAHVAGIIHRDLKPENVFLQRAKGGLDFVKIVDFGVSKFNQLSGGSAMSMTRTGAVVGTPYYMSPEQVKGAKTIDHRTDLYSAGVVLFECITGQLPFQADSFNELMFKIALEPPLDPEKAVPGLDPAFARILRKSTAREAADRYQTCEEFAQAIAEWMQGANVSMPQMHTTGPNFSVSGTGNSPPGAPQPGSATASFVATGAGVVALEKTTASVVINPEARPQRRSGGAIVAGVVVALVAAAIGIVVVRKGPAVAPPAAAAQAPVAAEPLPPSQPAPTSAAPAAAPVAPAAAPVAPAAVPVAETAATLAVPAEAIPSQDAAHPAASSHAPIGPATHHAAQASAPPASSAASSMTLKGRTIRTEL